MNLWNKTGLGLEENESLTMKIPKKRNPMKSESEQGMLLQKVQQWYVLYFFIFYKINEFDAHIYQGVSILVSLSYLYILLIC